MRAAANKQWSPAWTWPQGRSGIRARRCDRSRDGVPTATDCETTARTLCPSVCPSMPSPGRVRFPPANSTGKPSASLRADVRPRRDVPGRWGSASRARRRGGGLCRRSSGRRRVARQGQGSGPTSAPDPDHGNPFDVEHKAFGTELGIRAQQPEPSGEPRSRRVPIRQRVDPGRRQSEWIKETLGMVHRCHDRPVYARRGCCDLESALIGSPRSCLRD